MSSPLTKDLSAELLEIVEFVEGLDLTEEQRDEFHRIVSNANAQVKSQSITAKLFTKLISTNKFMMKYVLFDLDAARRERDEYKERLRKFGGKDVC